jgi:hypothetical protein
MSTLSVNTITAETGNTVSLASGKTLDASQGFNPPAGHVIQVLQDTATSIVSLGGASWIDTGLSINITPKYSNSKILVMLKQYFTFRTTTNAERQAEFRVLRDSSTQVGWQRINQWDQDNSTNAYHGKLAGYDLMDSPGTTNQINYHVEMYLSGSAADLYANHDGALSTLVAMEIKQ